MHGDVESPMLDWALYYAQRGWQVFPAHTILEGKCSCGRDDCASPGKHPWTAHGVKDATDDEQQILAWWREHPEANIAVATGSVSGIWVDDVDLRDEGVANWERFCAGRAVDTLTQRTGSGGVQMFFAWNSDLEVRCKTNVLPGVDVRGIGGYVIVPPSMHKTGNQYAWIQDPSSIEPAPAPDWVMELVMAEPMHGAPPPDATSTEDLALAPQEIASIRSALAVVTAECDRDTWIRIGMALHSTGPGEVAFTIWNEWSSTATSKYPGELELRRQWASFGSKKNGVRLGTLFHFAQQHGWTGKFEELGNGRVLATLPEAIRSPATPLAAHGAHPSWPTLDASSLHGLAGDFVRLVLPHTDADPAALYFSFLVVFGVAVGRSRYTCVGATRHYLNLFVALIGRTARARKGTALGWIESLFELAVPEFCRTNFKSGVVSGEGLIEAIRDPIIGTEPIRKRGSREITGYQDIQIDAGVKDKRLLVIEPEFARVLAVCGRDGNTLAPVLRDMFDGRDLRSMGRKLNKLTATNPHGGILAHATIEEFRSTLRLEDLHGGTINRFLFVCARRTRALALPTRPSEQEWDALAGQVRSAINHARTSYRVGEDGGGSDAQELEFDEKAKALWLKAYPGLTMEASGQYDAATARSDAQTLRLASVLAAIDCTRTIGEVHVAAALKLWQYCAASAAVLFPDGAPVESTKEQQQRDLVRWILGRPERQTTVRDLARNGPSAFRPAGAAEAALMDLADCGIGQWVDVHGSRALRLGGECGACDTTAENPEESAQVSHVAPSHAEKSSSKPHPGEPGSLATEGVEADAGDELPPAGSPDTCTEQIEDERCDTRAQIPEEIDEVSHVAPSHAEKSLVLDTPPASPGRKSDLREKTATGTTPPTTGPAVPCDATPKTLGENEQASHEQDATGDLVKAPPLTEGDGADGTAKRVTKDSPGRDAQSTDTAEDEFTRDGDATCDATPEFVERNAEVSHPPATPPAADKSKQPRVRRFADDVDDHGFDMGFKSTGGGAPETDGSPIGQDDLELVARVEGDLNLAYRFNERLGNKRGGGVKETPQLRVRIAREVWQEHGGAA